MPELRPKTKSDELCVHLTNMAQRLGRGAKLPSVRELSRSFNVSTRTLHDVLGRLEAEQVVTRRQGAGVWVSEQMSSVALCRNIALICNFNFLRSAGHSAFWNILIEQAQGRAAQKNEACQLHLTNPTSAQHELLATLMANIDAGQVQGVLGIGLNEDSIWWLGAQDVPLVTFACKSRWTVDFDGEQLVRLGVHQLAQQGCRRLGLWKPVGSQDTVSSNLGLALHAEAIFRAALKEAGLTLRPTLLQHGVAQLKAAEVTKELSQEQGYRIATQVFSQPKTSWPDGIVCTEDMMTHGVLFALQKLGVNVGSGGDVRIASHANKGSAVLRDRRNDLTLMEVNPAELVQTLFDQLETLMDGQVPTQSEVLIPPCLRAPRD